jgi:hypothetical protein
LAGDIKLRPDYLKTLVVGGITSPNNSSLGDTIQGGYFNGPGMKLRAFAKWTRLDSPLGYNNEIGFSCTNVSVGDSIDNNTLAGEIPHTSNQEVLISTSLIDFGIFTYWTDQYMLDNHPELISTVWKTDYAGDTNTIKITFESGTIETFVPVDMDSSKQYLIALYKSGTTTGVGTNTIFPVVTLPVGQDFDDMSSYDVVSTSSIDKTASPYRTIQTISTFSDNRPQVDGPIDSSSVDITFQQLDNVYKKTITKEGSGDSIVTLEDDITHQQYYGGMTSATTTSITTTDIGGGIIRTDTTTTIQQTFYVTRVIVESQQEVSKKSWSSPKLFLYQKGSGNSVLDALIVSPDATAAFLPFIPIRLDNKFLSKDYLPTIFSASKSAFRRSTGGSSLNKIISKISDNKSLSDIDYTFALFGVSLNVVEMACRQYLFTFFDQMRLLYSSQLLSVDAWQDKVEESKQSMLDFESWRLAQSDYSNPLCGTVAPTVIPTPQLPSSSIRLHSTNPELAFDYIISWSGITKETLSGLGKPSAKVKDYWLEKGTSTTVTRIGYGNYSDVGQVLQPIDPVIMKAICVYFQKSDTEYEKITIYALKHRNTIHNGHYVDIDAHTALDDVEESGFIIPIHEGIFKELPIVVSTQMTTACAYLIFNSYQDVTVKWYQTGIFSTILQLGAIVLAVVSVGTATGVSIGILGSSSAVGAAIGLSGTTALIVGAIANAIAAVIVFNIVSGVATQVFGAELGSIIASVVTFVMANPGIINSFSSSISTGFSELTKASNLLKLTNAVSGGYTQYVQASIGQYAKDAESFMQKYQTESRAVSDAFYAEFGNNAGAVISPLTRIDSSSGSSSGETPSSFFSRTLLTGSEIVELTHSMLSDFSKITLSTDLPS